MFGKPKEYEICQGCGKSFPKSKLKRCHTCGTILCPKCRKHHTCPVPIGTITIQHDTPSIVYESLHFEERDYGNYQCEIKISDMRIYELARNPEMMTDEEKQLLHSDFSLKRRYEHYRDIIEEKGY